MRLTCEELEALLERLADGALDEPAHTACERHLAECDRCTELVTLATMPTSAGSIDAGPDDALTAAILRRTTGAVCDEAETFLAERGFDEAERGATELVESHLSHCASCRRLAGALGALREDLPELAELAPGPGFVAAVLRASLPLAIRLRRWRRATVAGWVRRPRFALEMAYALTALLVVLVNVPGTPLAAMPRQAVALARTPPIEAIERPVRDGLETWSSTANERMTQSWNATETRMRTFLDGLASWWEKATEDSPSGRAEKTEETP